ncbi:hypothetical protein [Streptomyces halobius]|uniref:Uncharacterized protein n=1 Tax=Streptomyces halobius TaxID=2879846 RepID=A0ABY4MK22_9ACTN|nr:hypothetical protein [Streptomyces halobius]UQA97423.1 hypothetical protein K9S39_41160 [Streptomyces halobius]
MSDDDPQEGLAILLANARLDIPRERWEALDMRRAGLLWSATELGRVDLGRTPVAGSFSPSWGSGT